ncbi:type II TA system antitoxin MqsA family protein [Pantoea sp. App145]|uniref:type II TA system antitoxin MqsA family protein n=1 Tax=Pantoea sp. App145 TaxID=3071567 RepID=UPI003A811F1B
MKYESRDMQYEYKGKQTTIRNLSGHFCDACGEGILDDADAARFLTATTEFNREVDAKCFATVRKRLNLSQHQAAEWFDGGANAFGRYETGPLSLPFMLVKLFHLFDKQPELLDEYKRG